MDRDLCAICLEPGYDHLTGELLPCHHQYHLSCIRTWHNYSSNVECPTCRSKSDSINVHFGRINVLPPINVKLQPLMSPIRRSYSDSMRLLTRNLSSRRPQSFIVDDLTLEFNDCLSIDDTPLTSEDQSLSLDEIRDLDNTSDEENFESPRDIATCELCGELSEILERCCIRCPSFYHYQCLKNLAIEVNEPESWDQCIHCQEFLESHNHQSVYGNHVLHFDRLSRINNRRFSGDNANREDRYNRIKAEKTEKIKDAKHKIQSHVRKALHEFSRRRPVEKQRFTEINRNVSRILYKRSKYRYQNEIIDYDLEAYSQITSEYFKTYCSASNTVSV